MGNGFRYSKKYSTFEDSLAGHLFRFKACEVKIHYECAGKKLKVRGLICNVGSQFVDIRETVGCRKGKVTTVLIERICDIEWLEKHCDPCGKWKQCHKCETRYECDDSCD